MRVYEILLVFENLLRVQEDFSEFVCASLQTVLLCRLQLGGCYVRQAFFEAGFLHRQKHVGGVNCLLGKCFRNTHIAQRHELLAEKFVFRDIFGSFKFCVYNLRA